MSWGRTNITKCVRCRSICCTNTCDKRRSKNIYLLCPCRWLTARPVALTPHRCVSKASVWRQAVTSWLDPTRDWISVECVEGVGSPVERSLAPITKQRKCSKSFPYKWKWYTHTQRKNWVKCSTDTIQGSFYTEMRGRRHSTERFWSHNPTVM